MTSLYEYIDVERVDTPSEGSPPSNNFYDCRPSTSLQQDDNMEDEDVDVETTSDTSLDDSRILSEKSDESMEASDCLSSDLDSDSSDDYDAELPEVLQNSIIPVNDANLVLLEKLGEGSYGIVALAENIKTKSMYAIKLLSRTRLSKKYIHKEIQITDELTRSDESRDHIVIVYDFTEWGHLSCIVMEKMDIDLINYLRDREGKPLSMAKVKDLALQILKAIDYMHRLGIMHTDLKPENMLLKFNNNGKIDLKLADFGCSQYIKDSPQLLGKILTTVSYRAPEVLWGYEVDEKIDVFSAGLIMAELLVGQPLFPGRNEYVQMVNYVEIFGLPPYVDASINKEKFAVLENTHRGGQEYRMATYEEYFVETGNYLKDCIPRRPLYFCGISDLTRYSSNFLKSRVVSPDDVIFCNLLQNCLEQCSEDRFSLKQAISHPIFKM